MSRENVDLVRRNYELINSLGRKVYRGRDATKEFWHAIAAVNWIRRHARGLHVDPHRIPVGGTSAGAVTSLLLATDPSVPIDAAVSISGFLPAASYSRADAPTLFFKGTLDHTTPFALSKATAQGMAQAGVPVVFETLQGAGHVPWEYRSRFITHSAWFFYDRLGLAGRR